MAVVVKDINWRDCEKMHSYTFLTDLQHQIRIVKHSIRSFLRLLHSDFYKDGGVHQFAIDTIGLIANEYRKQQVGK